MGSLECADPAPTGVEAAMRLADAVEAGTEAPSVGLLERLKELADDPAAAVHACRALAAVAQRSQTAGRMVNRAVFLRARAFATSSDPQVVGFSAWALAGLALNAECNPPGGNEAILRHLRSLAERPGRTGPTHTAVAMGLAHLALNESFSSGHWEDMVACAERLLRRPDLGAEGCSWLALGLSLVAVHAPRQSTGPFARRLLEMLSAVLELGLEQGLGAVDVARHVGRGLERLLAPSSLYLPEVNHALFCAVLRVAAVARDDMDLQDSVARCFGHLSVGAVTNSSQLNGQLLQASLALSRRMVGILSAETQALRCVVGIARNSRDNRPVVNWLLMREILAAVRRGRGHEEMEIFALAGLGQLAWNSHNNGSRMNRLTMRALLDYTHRPVDDVKVQRFLSIALGHLAINSLHNRQSFNVLILRQLRLAIARAPDDFDTQEYAIAALANLCGSATRNCPRMNAALFQALSLQDAYDAAHFHNRRLLGMMLLANNGTACGASGACLVSSLFSPRLPLGFNTSRRSSPGQPASAQHPSGGAHRGPGAGLRRGPGGARIRPARGGPLGASCPRQRPSGQWPPGRGAGQPPGALCRGSVRGSRADQGPGGDREQWCGGAGVRGAWAAWAAGLPAFG
ncbi:hypothetical protein, variant 1 [Fonticula alba]|uniref:Uncharacterized protein n=1 Tax=Fonticula alba TaxID=691883 RepID=A0A058YZS6_FONAL|nr:hypothetical protein, variant 1 [Fonticula alba]KCV67479.1 hypothetical protein, variant 1 [Fonticula alba]|eukprot:XP_009498040.1 hypothetical protein, variant 1 [Fonticula alba]